MTGGSIRRLLLGLVAACLVLVACSSRVPAPVYDRSIGSDQRAAGDRPPTGYLVRRGDTLYSIAWRYGLDYRELARWNGIGAPYTIYAGERLTLEEPAGLPPLHRGRTPAEASVATAAAPAPDTRDPRPALEPPPASAGAAAPGGPGPSPSKSPDGPASAGASAARDAAPTAPAVAEPEPVAVATATPEAADAVARQPVNPSRTPTAWLWPADGPVLNTYAVDDPARKGIDIGGEVGAPVRAAADGEVVYSGAGLVGYGELVIIKHGPRFLSAYGHNRKRLVAEGDVVRAGQQIAELGSSGAPRAMLHFEIRDNGRPKNPLSYLPNR